VKLRPQYLTSQDGLNAQGIREIWYIHVRTLCTTKLSFTDKKITIVISLRNPGSITWQFGTSIASVTVTCNPQLGGVMTQEKGKWREICEAMVKESDPRKMSELAAQLVAALDEQKSGSAPRAKNIQTESPKPESGSRLIRWAVRSSSGHRANVAREQEET
jgi:hypothetical protein